MLQFCVQLNTEGREDDALFGEVDLRVSYRTRAYSRYQQDITHAFAVDIAYRFIDRNFAVSISTDVHEGATGLFIVSVNGDVLPDPVLRPFLQHEITVKQLTNFVVAVTTEDFRLEFDADTRIYLRLDSRFDSKVQHCNVQQYRCEVTAEQAAGLSAGLNDTNILQTVTTITYFLESKKEGDQNCSVLY